MGSRKIPLACHTQRSPDALWWDTDEKSLFSLCFHEKSIPALLGMSKESTFCGDR
jgi:hypothetical protein